MNGLRYVDLFAGTGAFSHCLDKVGAQCVFANDMDKNSKKIYEHNFPHHNFVLGDLNNIANEDIPAHDILCGGFPCQPFSIAGKQMGFDDQRANVFHKIISILKHHNPKIVILENVKNIKSHDKGNTFKVISEELTSAGYFMQERIIDTSKITSVPHHRERIYMVCVKTKAMADAISLDFEQTVPSPLHSIMTSDIADKYYYTDKLAVYDLVKESVTKPVTDGVIYQYRRYYVRENKSGVCPTLTANMGGGGHNVPIIRDAVGIRKLVPRECFRLQGFPDDYSLDCSLSDSALYKLAGNAVTVPVVKRVVDAITTVL